tara:strand:- start:128 stop:457 length:330 start_codon:yes stop_codon:yes gene_type:complete
VLYGSVLEWVCQERKGWRKFENFKILREGLKPRTKYVFLGDNGKSEKDFEAASRIVDAFPKELQCVFLHAVSGETARWSTSASRERQSLPTAYPVATAYLRLEAPSRLH